MDDIFTQMVLFQPHSATSRAAAQRYAPIAGGARRRVFDAIAGAFNGLTDEEQQDMLQLNPSTQRPRRIELQRAGLVTDSGATRKTRSGMAAVVWAATGQPYPAHFPKPKKP